MSNVLRLNLRSQRLTQDEGGHAVWQVQTSTQEWGGGPNRALALRRVERPLVPRRG